MAGENEKQHPGTDRVSDTTGLVDAFGLLGQRWNGVLLGALSEGPLGFAELKRAVAGISDSVLAERLARLGAAGVIERVIGEGPPVSTSYRLTTAGLALLPALRELSAWATAYLPPAGA